jgi:hypothetical protein
VGIELVSPDIDRAVPPIPRLGILVGPRDLVSRMNVRAESNDLMVVRRPRIGMKKDRPTVNLAGCASLSRQPLSCLLVGRPVIRPATLTTFGRLRPLPSDEKWQVTPRLAAVQRHLLACDVPARLQPASPTAVATVSRPPQVRRPARTRPPGPAPLSCPSAPPRGQISPPQSRRVDPAGHAGSARSPVGRPRRRTGP